MNPSDRIPPSNSLNHQAVGLKTENPCLLFDTKVFAHGNLNDVSRGGIHRYASQLLIALEQSDSQENWPHELLPICTDILLAASADDELRELEECHQLQLRKARPSNTLKRPKLPDPPLLLKNLLRPVYRKLKRSAWVQSKSQHQLEKLLKRVDLNNSIFHSPFQSVPDTIRSCGLGHVVVTVYDMLPHIYPEFFTEETIREFDALIDQLQPSDHVICISESTRHDFLRSHPNTPADQVHVTPLAAAPSLRPVNDVIQKADLRAQLGLAASDQVVLSLCTLEPRKNLTTLITAFEQLRRRSDGSSIKLVLAGAMGWKTTALSEQLRHSPEAEAIVVSGHISEQQLGCLYSLADVFVYPSLYEGFGLPPLEAMQCGAPVIVGNHSSLPEVVGDAALMVDPRSALELEQAIASLLGSTQERNERHLRSLAQAARFSWARTAALTTDVYRTMLNHRG